MTETIKLNELKKLIIESVNSSIQNYFESDRQNELLTVTQASDILGVSVSTIYGWLGKTSIPYIRPGGNKIYFIKKNLLKWLSDSKKEVSNGK